MIGKDFVTAGNAIFTISSAKTGKHYTYRVTAKEATENKPPVHFVGLLTGPENTADYSYLGVLNAESGEVRLTKASKFAQDSVPVRALRWALSFVWTGATHPDLEVRHEGRCGRCGRTLTVPESIDRGIGPECAGKLGG